MIKEEAQLARFQEEDSLQNATRTASIKLQKANKQPGCEESAPGALNGKPNLGFEGGKDGDYLLQNWHQRECHEGADSAMQRNECGSPSQTLEALNAPETP